MMGARASDVAVRRGRSDAPAMAPPEQEAPRSRLAAGLVWLLILTYIILFSWLSILRHETFGSGAMDLGYTDQVVWNTLHGRFMRFSTYENAPIDLPLENFRRIDTLLAYHVEPLLAAISPLYLLYDSPVTLLVLQTVVIALGALPAFALARERLRSDVAGVVFALAYLLAPALQGANLADFHGVAMTSSLLLFALSALHRRRYGAFLALAVVSMAAREDVSLLVAMMGLYVLLRLQERRVGLLAIGLGLGWFAICTQVILPHYNGLPISPFLHRLAIFGPTLKASVENLLAEPALLARWLLKPEIVSYLGGLLATAGFMSLLDPTTLILCAPVTAMNIFSSWSWTYSGGAHYSASIIPFVIASGIHGLGFLSDQASARLGIPRRVAVIALSALVLVISVRNHHLLGISPISRTFSVPRVTDHHRQVREIMGLIPDDARVSAQSNLYPHLAHRERAYLFPAINDAQYVILDVTSPSYPILMDRMYSETWALVRSAEFEIMDARDGCLLFRRSDAGEAASLPDAFFSFARAGREEIGNPVQAQFGTAIELLGYDHQVLNVVHAHEPPATITTYWRRLKPLSSDFSTAFFFTREDGAIAGNFDGWTFTALWYPPSAWQEGEIVRMETPILPIGQMHDVLLAVTWPRADSWLIEDRLKPIVSPDDAPLDVLQERSLLRLFSFR